MTDKERMDLLYHVCKETLVILEDEQVKYNNAMFEYFQAIHRHNEEVKDRISTILKLLEEI